MIVLNTAQKAKIEYLDKVIDKMTIEQLKVLTEADQIVSVLAGTTEPVGLLSQMAAENYKMSTEIMNLQSQLYSLKSDLSTLVKLVTKPFEYNNASDAQSLKGRHNVY